MVLSNRKLTVNELRGSQIIINSEKQKMLTILNKSYHIKLIIKIQLD